MTNTVFYLQNGQVIGFSLTGHTTDYDSEEGRLVCSAVSSAAYLTANTVTDVIKAKADISEQDGKLSLIVTDKQEQCAPLLSGFQLHIKQLSQQYPNFISIKTEVLFDA